MDRKEKTIDRKKALFHAFMVFAAVIEYQCCDQKWRKQLCGAWAGFHVISVIDDLTGD